MLIYINKNKSLQNRFTKYVQIDTQSDPSSPTVPSTEKQKDLGRVLVAELLEMGIADAHLDEYGYVYATIPSNSDKKVPVICFCSHMDTSPDCSGYGVKPLIHENYQGQDLVLPDDPSVVLKMAEHPDLKHQIGNDIITASGTTLLGADNKAGLAEIMEAAAFLMKNPELKHGTIKILFTPDEEIGRGVDKVNLEKLGADFAYTIDGETLGSIEDETFSADGAVLSIRGVSAHPGFAKGKMESAIKILSDVISALPADCLSPESTEAKEGFIHPVSISGNVEQAEARFILRAFNDEELAANGELLDATVQNIIEDFPNSTYELKITEQYRNMKQVLDQYPQVIEYGIAAIKRTGIRPKQQSIRGGTDGSRLSFMGLPCPNIFAGEHAFHGKQEWASVQDMEKAVETIVNIATVWEEKA
ncbi:peptidase T [Pedobacter heparinus]|uniref:Peptidase T n=1 Tax=Pedobacter heparinus (strain ATCC 13125 / DSM 2366 / CIP 104194 / JCM 7457 / NBRC 12017 / NCIMB 9290 / NRRL B-14731 / HIM 762-3) TaxID=485917 RepID=C6XY60_PEDHD|nr:peptidase T [Pedobacter heparinus]ACU02327.1 peptidase T [Pedobacter heparinus DSM 2366]